MASGQHRGRETERGDKTAAQGIEWAARGLKSLSPEQERIIRQGVKSFSWRENETFKPAPIFKLASQCVQWNALTRKSHTRKRERGSFNFHALNKRGAEQLTMLSDYINKNELVFLAHISFNQVGTRSCFIRKY